MAASKITNLLPTQEMSILFNQPDFRSIDPRDLGIISLKRTGLFTFKISLHHRLINSDLKVFRANPIPHYINVTSNPTKVRYTGNHFMVHNVTNGCTKAINEPMTDLIVTSCRADNHIDVNLDLWEPINCFNINSCEKPTIKFSSEHSYIECLFNIIVIDNSTMKCPHYPFRLPITTEFILDGYHHKVDSKLMQLHDELPNDIIVKIQTPPNSKMSTNNLSS